MRNCATTILLTMAMLALTGCRPTSHSNDRQHQSNDSTSVVKESPAAVANSFLAAVYRDLMGDDAPLVVLAEPGMCPGHFDLRPSQVRRLRSCRLLLRFDFQSSMDSRLSQDRDGPIRVVGVTVSGGICEPESYLSACRQVAQSLVEEGTLTPKKAESRLASISKRMGELSRWIKAEIENAAIRDEPVLSSNHQAAFCRYLGLDVVAEFSSADTVSRSQIDRAIEAGSRAKVRLVVANLPEGRQLADALAARLEAKVAVFGNFPNGLEPQAFNELIRQNVAALIEASKT